MYQHVSPSSCNIVSFLHYDINGYRNGKMVDLPAFRNSGWDGWDGWDSWPESDLQPPASGKNHDQLVDGMEYYIYNIS